MSASAERITLRPGHTLEKPAQVNLEAFRAIRKVGCNCPACYQARTIKLNAGK